ncbi:hypothetical protein EFY87_00405 [Flexivirga caeni]|uniref:Uncharacterized protein n=1 Tax=Flexivirga caeni TaxID=2294115 RepID=A0A3M9MHW8_9MICO|nr:hypothetical protein EFY87_00405 [Flexivirga caeni]
MLEAVEIIWRMVPDFRLAQLIEVIGASFSTEDDELIQLIQSDLATLVPRPPWGPDRDQLAAVQARLVELRERGRTRSLTGSRQTRSKDIRFETRRSSRVSYQRVSDGR